jgi:hypothetical protein
MAANFQNIIGLQLGQGAVTAAYTSFYKVPPDTRTYIKQFDICNTTAAAINVYVSFVPNAGTAGASNAILYNTTVPAYSPLQWCGVQILNAGGTIQAKASAVGCTITLTGGEAQ